MTATWDRSMMKTLLWITIQASLIGKIVDQSSRWKISRSSRSQTRRSGTVSEINGLTEIKEERMVRRRSRRHRSRTRGSTTPNSCKFLINRIWIITRNKESTWRMTARKNYQETQTNQTSRRRYVLRICWCWRMPIMDRIFIDLASQSTRPAQTCPRWPRNRETWTRAWWRSSTVPRAPSN